VSSFGALLGYKKVQECGFWLARNAVRVHGQLDADRGYMIGQRRVALGLGALL
jgi:hypothetical protein